MASCEPTDMDPPGGAGPSWGVSASGPSVAEADDRDKAGGELQGCKLVPSSI